MSHTNLKMTVLSLLNVVVNSDNCESNTLEKGGSVNSSTLI